MHQFIGGHLGLKKTFWCHIVHIQLEIVTLMYPLSALGIGQTRVLEGVSTQTQISWLEV